MENNFTQKKAKSFKLLSIGTVAIIGAITVLNNPNVREKIPFLPSTSKYIKIVDTYIYEKNYKAALNTINEAIKFDYKNPDLYIERAKIHYLMGDEMRKLQDYQQAILLKPANKEDYLQSLVSSYGYSTQEGIKGYTRAIEIDPSNAGLYVERGKLNSYYDTNERAAALKDFNTAIKLDSKNIKAYEQRAKFLSYIFNAKKEELHMKKNQLQVTTIIALTAIVVLPNIFSNYTRPANANTHDQCIRLINQGNAKIGRIAR